MQIDIEGPAFSQISFAHVVRSIAFALEDLGVKVSIQATDKHQLGYKSVASEESYNRLLRLSNREPAGQFKVIYNFPVSMRNACNGYNFAITSWETTAAPIEWVRELNSRADQVWNISSFVEDAFLKSGLSPVKSKVLFLGLNPKFFNQTVPPIQLKTSKRFKFLHLGVAQERKGTPLLLEAYTQEFTAKDDVCLVIKSNGFGDITHLVRKYQSRGPEILYIHDEAPESSLGGYYRASDCLVHPAHAEGAGLTVLESLACGRPAIVPLYSGLRDFCDENSCFAVRYKEAPLTQSYGGTTKNGLEAWANISPKDLALQMRHAYKNPKDVQRKGEFAAETIQKRFTWHHTARNILKYIAEASNSSIDIPDVPPIQIPEITSRSEKSGKKIGVLTSGNIFHESAWYAKASAERSVSPIVGFSTTKSFLKFQATPPSALSVAEKCKENGIDALQIHYDESLIKPELLPIFMEKLHTAGIGSILFMHGDLPPVIPYNFFYLAQYFCTNSNKIRNNLLRNGCPLDRIKIIPAIKWQLKHPKIDTKKNRLVTIVLSEQNKSECLEFLANFVPAANMVTAILTNDDKLLSMSVTLPAQSSLVRITSFEQFAEYVSSADVVICPYAKPGKNTLLLPLIGLNSNVFSNPDYLGSEIGGIHPLDQWQKTFTDKRRNLQNESDYIKVTESIYYGVRPGIPSQMIAPALPQEPEFSLEQEITLLEI